MYKYFKRDKTFLIYKPINKTKRFGRMKNSTYLCRRNKNNIKKLNKMRTIINIEAIGYAYEAGSFVSGLTLSVE